MEKRYLAGDIGGTKTRLALFSPESGACEALERETFLSQDHDSLETILRVYLQDKNYLITGASFGVAGPIIGQKARVTNLQWVVDKVSLQQLLGGIDVHLLNDLHAISSAVPNLKADEIEELIQGTAAPQGAIGVVAPGTGLGEGFLIWDGKRYQPHPSEGGHTSFGPETSLQLELLNYMDNIYNHVSYERVCSGLGIANLYSFLRNVKGLEEPGWLREQLDEVEDKTPLIVQAALEKKAEICIQTMDLFVSILGSEAGNLALKVLATGGVYLGGGIPRRIMPLLRGDTFKEGFLDKGRFAGMLTRVPVYVITHPHSGVFGAACHGLQNLT
ncbi:MAG: glucokinase [Anaerolineales bacterium]|nr:glucokinase [Anaerolineales bacterium]